MAINENAAHGTTRAHGATRIAISGKSGCGNTTIGRLTSERLGLRFINWTFRNLAEQKGVPFEAALKLAAVDSSWDREVDEHQVRLAMEDGGCVLSSRLAIWMLKAAGLKVYLKARPETRATRIVKREGGTLGKTAAFTARRDKADHDRYLALYNINNDDFVFADLIIETDDKTPEEIVDLIVEQAGSGIRGIS
jgi:cytidylate kinase